ncbi:hypothetical protein DFH08DRAFT_833558 [Mycena albidolilacea]|uniref:Cation efflux protein transmembrane domain-containing protein n=1 Tax=Mycena albidolilacea TaxID=1033008 RepID=A0AAD7AQH2_9AGAR|nr:hypothetical protein DFH08DRAFT_833558 [Mycena albidolilacea]
MPSYRRLQQYALAISVLSILYNGAEGGVSIGLGAEASSRSLVFFGAQSAIEVISACIVVWRFSSVAKPGEERARTLSPRELKIEKYASGSIGTLLLCLALLTEAIAIPGLVKHDQPDSSNASLVISASALVIMVFIWLPKRYLARELNSSVMQGEATCSLSCIQITCVLFGGSLVFRLWKAGWWVDGVISLVLGLLFAKQGYEMIQWVRDPEFDGGCCKTCKTDGRPEAAEMGERYRDLCDCCAEKPECAAADDCQCPTNAERTCCAPRADQEKCCTHKMISANPRVEIANTNAAPDACCLEGNSNCCAIGRDSAENATVSGPGPVLPSNPGAEIVNEDCAQDACC